MSQYDRSMKRFRDFKYTFGVKEGAFGRTINVRARSSLEAGAILIETGQYNSEHQGHSLVDPAGATR